VEPDVIEDGVLNVWGINFDVLIGHLHACIYMHYCVNYCLNLIVLLSESLGILEMETIVGYNWMILQIIR